MIQRLILDLGRMEEKFETLTKNQNASSAAFSKVTSSDWTKDSSDGSMVGMVLHTAAMLSFEDVGKEIKFALLIILLKQPCGISIMRLKQESLILVD